MAIVWNDNLKTGISSIDEQHQSLFETANRLEKSKDDESIFYRVLSDLQEYIFLHFKTEEEYMRYTGYLEYEEHKECHEKFANDLNKILRKNSQHSSIMESRQELIAFVEDWITNHYTNEDVKMAAYLNAQFFKS